MELISSLGETWLYKTFLCVEHANSELVNSLLCTELTNRTKFVLYNLQSPKLSSIFESPTDSVLTVHEIIKQKHPISAIVELDKNA